MIPLQGFAPDVDPNTPGALMDCEQVIPYESGLKGAPSCVSVGVSALAATCVGSASVSDLSGNRRLYAGTAANLYEQTGTGWTSRSGSTYTLGADDRWSFIQYANATLAVTPTLTVQRSTGGAFASVAGSPQAKIIEAASGFALAFNTSTSADEWYCSAYLDETNWTLSVANQCVKGRLIGGSGPITAAKRFGDDVAAYKGGTMFVGRYVGAPDVWRWTQVSTDVGCVGQEAVADTVIGHVFIGRDNVYVFDGTTPRPLPGWQQVRRWLFADMNPTYQYKSIVQWDRGKNLVWFFYPSGSSTVCNSALVYHVLTQKWGRANNTIEAAVNYTTPTITYDSGSALITTYNGSPAIPYDSPFWLAGTSAPAVFDSTHTICTLSGASSASSMTTGDFGDEAAYSFVSDVRVRYTLAPTTSSVTGYVKDTNGVSVATAATGSVTDGRHNMRQRGRFHRFKVATTGDFVATAIRVEAQQAGAR